MTPPIKKYSEAFRRQVVAEYEAGKSVLSLQRKYGIGGAGTIARWIHQYAKEGLRHEVIRIQTAAEADRVKALEQQVTELEQALGKVMLEKLKLESILEELQVDAQQVKKNARPSSTGSPKKSSSNAS